MWKNNMLFLICFCLFLVSSAFAASALAAGVETLGDLKVQGVIESTSGGFKFPDGSRLTTSGLNGLLFNVGIVVDDSGSNTGNLNPGAIKFGGESSGEGLASQRTSSGNQFGLDFYSNFIKRMSITNGGNVGIGTDNPGARLDVAGNARISGSLAAGPGLTGTPLAHGVVSAAGNFLDLSHSSNVIAISRTATGIYEILVNGEYMGFSNYTTVVSMVDTGPGLTSYSYNNGNLIVRTYTTNGVLANMAFSFITLKK